MKILVNGYTVTEHIELRINKESMKDIYKIDNVIGNIKKNKKLYTRVVFYTAIVLFQMDIISYANGFESSIDEIGNKILSMLNLFARWGCLSMGLKEMITTLLNGGNMKQASVSGIQYWLGYIFIKIYPTLFEMMSDIKF
ncbi:hypothetical protein QOZ83_16940 [Romboutsia sedimentorum]|uniref:hypothetical protein n=1 Tax=Romboutsia sedimentorum TaxID=1368474 RepID=UPI0024DE5818|nr:hypothetical protein [Romboutsia sedimentorum]MDK2587527.1 hypothetical protein [Romboutsia sedimentorum]